MADISGITLNGTDYGISGGGGGGAVDSVNGQTGAVVLGASDVGAIASPSSPSSGKFLKYNGSSWIADNAPVTSVNSQTGAVSLSIPSTPSDIGAEPAITEVTVSSTGSVSQALDAGKIYHFTGAITALTITLNATTGIPHYHFDFLSGSTAPTLTMPQTVTMPDSFAVEASKRYEVDVLNNYGAVISWATS